MIVKGASKITNLLTLKFSWTSVSLVDFNARDIEKDEKTFSAGAASYTVLCLAFLDFLLAGAAKVA